MNSRIHKKSGVNISVSTSVTDQRRSVTWHKSQMTSLATKRTTLSTIRPRSSDRYTIQIRSQEDYFSKKNAQQKKQSFDSFNRRQSKKVKAYNQKLDQNYGFQKLLFQEFLEHTKFEKDNESFVNLKSYLNDQTIQQEQTFIDQNNQSISELSQQKGLNQTSLDTNSQLNLWEGKWDTMYQIYEHIKNIESRIERENEQEHNYQQSLKQMKEDKLISENNRINLQDGQLTLLELNAIYQQLQISENERNYFEIDKLLSKNKFFNRFNKGVRNGILEKCQFYILKKGQILIEQGKESNILFIILRGSCSLTVTTELSDGSQHDYQMISFYDGQHFSESNLVSHEKDNQVMDKTDLMFSTLYKYPLFSKPENKRKKTVTVTSKIVAQEKIWFLKMKNDQFQKILIQSVEKDIEPKLDVLQRISFFKNSLPIMLVPLAATVSTQNFYFGDYVIKAKDYIDRLYILSNGDCRVLIDSRRLRQIRHVNRTNYLRPFTYKTIRENSSKISSKQEGFSHFYCQPPIADRKSYDKGSKIKIDDNLMEYTHHYVLRKLQIGDIICGRAIFTQDDYIKKQKDHPSMSQQAEVNVVVKSTTAELFSLDYKQFATLPEILQVQLKRGLMKQSEFDDYDVENIRKVDDDWEIVKQAYCKSCCK